MSSETIDLKLFAESYNRLVEAHFELQRQVKILEGRFISKSMRVEDEVENIQQQIRDLTTKDNEGINNLRNTLERVSREIELIEGRVSQLTKTDQTQKEEVGAGDV